HPQMPHQLAKQPDGVTAGPAAQLQRFLRGLHAGLHPDEITHVRPESLIETDEKVDGARARFALVGRARMELMRGWKDSASVMSAKRCRLKMSTWQRCLEKFTADAAKVVGEPGTGRTLQKKWSQLMIERAIVLEGKSLRLRFEKEIERIVDRHLGDEVHLDLKFAGGFLEDNPGWVLGCGRY